MNTTLKPEVKQLWVKELRSGKYGQAIGRLKGKGNTYCCLGVLCEISPVKENVESACDCCNDNLITYWDEESGVLPFAVREWAGTGTDRDIRMALNSDDIKRLTDKYGTNAFVTVCDSDDVEVVYGSSLNDAGVSFSDIADLIEKYL